MNYMITLAFSISVFLTSSCTGASTNEAAAIPNSNIPTTTSQPKVTEPQATECKICTFDHVAYKGELAKQEIEGLLLALNDEYMAMATYQQINTDFNNPRPFVNIVEAEMRHAERLKGLFAKYGIAIPENPWPGSVEKFTSVVEACNAGIDGEILNRDLYTRLFKTTNRQDIIATYKDLQRASEENHLPAFERCATGGAGQGRGNGRPATR
jgi:hypothetical protein